MPRSSSSVGRDRDELADVARAPVVASPPSSLEQRARPGRPPPSAPIGRRARRRAPSTSIPESSPSTHGRPEPRRGRSAPCRARSRSTSRRSRAGSRRRRAARARQPGQQRRAARAACARSARRGRASVGPPHLRARVEVGERRRRRRAAIELCEPKSSVDAASVCLLAPRAHARARAELERVEQRRAGSRSARQLDPSRRSSRPDALDQSGTRRSAAARARRARRRRDRRPPQ